jgi:hypothetical protein
VAISQAALHVQTFGEVRVEPCADFPKFQEALTSAQAVYNLKTPHLLRCLRTITRNYKKQEFTSEQISQIFIDNLRAICPVCCTWTGGAALVNLMVYADLNHGKEPIAGFNQVRRLYYGFCANAQCESKESFLIWKGCPETEEKIREHLKALRSSKENTRQLGGTRADGLLTTGDVMAFTKDVLYTLRQIETDRPLWVQGRFHDVIVCVSAIKYPISFARNTFSGGYPAFLKQILTESRKTRKDISVAHWISTQEEKGWKLNLAFSPPETLPRDEQYLILPPELL